MAGKIATMSTVEARRYVYRVLAVSLANDIDNGAGWLEEHPGPLKRPMNEFDARRVERAAELILKKLKKAGGE